MTWRQFWQLIAACIAVPLFLAMVSCGTQKNLEYEVQFRDSTIIHHIYDTTRVTVIDSVKVDAASSTETKTETTITFADSGGTFNATTGDATGVAMLNTSSSHAENSTTSVTATHRLDSLMAKVDSLTQVNVALQEHLEQEQQPAPRPTRTGWDKFCTKWFIGSAILLLVLLLWWVADYIPALKGIKTIIKTFIKL